MSVAHMAKLAADNRQLQERIQELETKLAGHTKRAAAEATLVELMRDPCTGLDWKPVDVEDFLAKRAEIEKLDDIGLARTAVKMASTHSFSVGDPDEGQATNFPSSGSKADDEFVSHFLNSEYAG